MLQEVEVQSLNVVHSGKIYKASFYVECGVLHADLAGKACTTITVANPRDLVRALMTERILELERTGRLVGPGIAH